MGDGEIQLMRGARRFDGGNYNFIGAVAADAALDLLHELGTENIEEHVCGLARRLGTGFHELGFPVCGWPPEDHWSSTLTIGNYDPRVSEHDSADDAMINDLFAHLTKNGVKLTIRRGMLRFGLHLYNNAEDVDKVLALTKEWQDTSV